ncbi:MAG: hypothetical protein WD069_03750 [Planctomycetales bacterium]
MTYSRRILHYSPGPADLVGAVSDRAVAGCWFELHRQGGCGAGEVRLRDEFPNRHAIAPGDWIACEYAPGDRWYFGRVEQRQARSPAGVTLRLEGMGIELGEVFPGGFDPAAGDGRPPHRYARGDFFPFDPDRSEETIDAVSEPQGLLALLVQQYVVPGTHIVHEAELIEEAVQATQVESLKFRGEESVRAIVKEIALRARNAAWGVDEAGRFYFLKPRSNVVATYREGVDLLSLEETRDRDLLYNRVSLVGGYVYVPKTSGGARNLFRWQGHYVQPASRALHGERRIRLQVPWIRTRTDSREFVREFFRVYADPAARYVIEVANATALPRPWSGRVRVLDRNGVEIVAQQVETVRVEFDRAPKLRMEIGPENPHTHWPPPPRDDRWEIPAPDERNSGWGGSEISFTWGPSGSLGPPPSESFPEESDSFPSGSSQFSFPSGESSDEPSSGFSSSYSSSGSSSFEDSSSGGGPGGDPGDTLWTGGPGEESRLYLQSGQFTSTIKTSQDASLWDDSRDIAFDGTNTVRAGGSENGEVLWLVSGLFSSVVKTSQAVQGLVEIAFLTGASWDGTDTPWCAIDDSKLYLQSGQFSSTIKTSQDTAAIDAVPTAISTAGPHTPWCGISSLRLILQSGRFTSTVKTSLGIGAIESSVHAISWDGTNTPWGGDVERKLTLQSGQFTSTIKTSLSVGAINELAGIDITNVELRL